MKISMKKTIYIYTIFLIFSFQLHAQNDTIKYEVGILGVASSGAYSPFWIQNRAYGKISSAPMNKQFPALSDIRCGLTVGADFGKLYGNSIGCMFSIRKSGDLFHY